MELIALLLACIAFPPLGLAVLFVVLMAAYFAAWGLLILGSLFAALCLFHGIWWPALVVGLIWAWLFAD